MHETILSWEMYSTQKNAAELYPGMERDRITAKLPMLICILNWLFTYAIDNAQGQYLSHTVLQI